ncbi:hypothetical protein HBH96_065990 [Parastagonospora nodorum]|nr:hypothetical protein HBH96_065990 [Parastagonospora nodorum]
MLLIRVTLLSAALANASTLFSVAIPSINNSTLVGTSQTISSPSKSIPASQTPGPVGTCTSIEGKAMQTCFQWPQPGQPHPTASATTSTSQNATTSTAPDGGRNESGCGACGVADDDVFDESEGGGGWAVMMDWVEGCCRF